MGIAYPKELRADAARQGKDLFAVGFAEAKGKGVSEAIGPLDWRMADALFSFCLSVRFGRPPSEAFAEINWPDATAEAKPGGEV